jgi:hypothetical protein
MSGMRPGGPGGHEADAAPDPFSSSDAAPAQLASPWNDQRLVAGLVAQPHTGDVWEVDGQPGGRSLRGTTATPTRRVTNATASFALLGRFARCPASR